MLFKVEQSVLQKLLDYLSNQPFKEVVELIQVLSKSEAVEEPKEV